MAFSILNPSLQLTEQMGTVSFVTNKTGTSFGILIEYLRPLAPLKLNTPVVTITYSNQSKPGVTMMGEPFADIVQQGDLDDCVEETHYYQFIGRIEGLDLNTFDLRKHRCSAWELLNRLSYDSARTYHCDIEKLKVYPIDQELLGNIALFIAHTEKHLSLTLPAPHFYQGTKEAWLQEVDSIIVHKRYFLSYQLYTSLAILTCISLLMLTILAAMSLIAVSPVSMACFMGATLTTGVIGTIGLFKAVEHKNLFSKMEMEITGVDPTFSF